MNQRSWLHARPDGRVWICILVFDRVRKLFWLNDHRSTYLVPLETICLSVDKEAYYKAKNSTAEIKLISLLVIQIVCNSYKLR